MKILLSIVLAILFTSGFLTAEDTSNTTTEGTTTTSSTTTTVTTVSTTAAPTTSTSEPPPTTTTITTSTATPPPPTTSTSEPTTSSSTDTPTTITPTSTKAPSPTPPTPADCSWNITQENVTCIRVMMKALFTISVEDRKEYIALTQNASADQSDCHLSNDTQKLVLTEPNYTLIMIFAKEAGKVYVNSTSFSYILPERKGTEESDKKLFAVKSGDSFKCEASEDVTLGNVTMELSNVRIQAFGEKENTGFGAVEVCEADDKVSDAVPIAVGCALAALIIIVLIAYLVGRRQSRQKGYQSV